MYLDLDFFTKGEQENPLLRKEVHKAYYDKPIASTKSSMLKPNKSRVISHKKMCHNLHDNQIFDHSKNESEQKNRAYVRVWPTNPYRRSCRREKPAREKAKEMNCNCNSKISQSFNTNGGMRPTYPMCIAPSQLTNVVLASSLSYSHQRPYRPTNRFGSNESFIQGGRVSRRSFSLDREHGASTYTRRMRKKVLENDQGSTGNAASNALCSRADQFSSLQWSLTNKAENDSASFDFFEPYHKLRASLFGKVRGQMISISDTKNRNDKGDKKENRRCPSPIKKAWEKDYRQVQVADATSTVDKDECNTSQNLKEVTTLKDMGDIDEEKSSKEAAVVKGLGVDYTSDRSSRHLCPAIIEGVDEHDKCMVIIDSKMTKNENENKYPPPEGRTLALPGSWVLISLKGKTRRARVAKKSGDRLLVVTEKGRKSWIESSDIANEKHFETYEALLRSLVGSGKRLDFKV